MKNLPRDEEDSGFYDMFVPLTTKKAIIFIVIVGFIVFFNALFNEFVWDDKTYIIFEPLVHSLNLGEIFGTNLYNSIGQYRPLPALYFALLYNLFNQTPFYYHFFSLALHISNTILLFFLFKHFLSRNISFLLALIFLTHPVQVESVSYIASAGNLLFFFFGIIALLLSLSNTIGWKKLLIICVLLFLSLLTKETAALFFIIIFYWWIFLKKRRIISRLILIGITIATYLTIRVYIGGSHLSSPELAPIAQLSLSERIINIPSVVFHYLVILFLPINLSIQQLWIIESINFQNFFFPLIIDVTFFLLLCLIGNYIFKINTKTFKVYVFFLCWFILGIAFHSQIFPLDWTVADRWLYFPLAGGLGLVGIIFQSLKFPFKQQKKIWILLAFIIVILLSIRTMIRNADWTNPISLYTHDIKINDNYDIENNLGSEYFVNQDYNSAIFHYKKSIEFFPFELNYGNLGTAYLYAGDIHNAKSSFYKALESKSYSSETQTHYAATYKSLAWTLLYLKEFSSAKKIIVDGLREYPNDAQLLYELALCEYKMKDYNKAYNAIKMARQMDPNDKSIQFVYKQIINKADIEIGSSNVTIDIKGLQ